MKKEEAARFLWRHNDDREMGKRAMRLVIRCMALVGILEMVDEDKYTISTLEHEHSNGMHEGDPPGACFSCALDDGFDAVMSWIRNNCDPVEKGDT